MANLDLSPDELAYIEARRAGENNPDGPGHPQPMAEGTRAWGQLEPPNPATVTRLIPPTDWVEKQLRNLSAVGEQNYREGITRPKKDPIQAGIAAQPAYEAKMRDPAVLARREAGLRRTNIDEWAFLAETLGAPRLVQGVVQRRGKVERAVTSLHSFLSQHLQRIDAMPNVTDADRERRMVENLRGLRGFKSR